MTAALWLTHVPLPAPLLYTPHRKAWEKSKRTIEGTDDLRLKSKEEAAVWHTLYGKVRAVQAAGRHVHAGCCWCWFLLLVK